MKSAASRKEQLDRRYLHRRSELGYTPYKIFAMRKEPEAIDRTTQARFTREARQAFELGRFEARRDKLLALRDAVDRELEALEKEIGLAA